MTSPSSSRQLRQMLRPAAALLLPGVSNALAFDGLGESLGDVFLPHHLGEALRAILPGYDLIGHSLGGW